MLFNINKEFVQKFNQYRQKEEFEKLKAKYGDKKIQKRSENNAKLREADENESVSSSSSSSDSDDDDNWVDKEQEDFLNLYKALCTNDPSLDDPNKQWFHDPNEGESKDPGNGLEQDPKSKTSGKRSKKVKKDELRLADYQREFLLNDNGLEDDLISKDANQIAKLDSDDVLEQIKLSTDTIQKKEFLKEADEAFERAAAEPINSNSKFANDSQLSFLQKRLVIDDGIQEKKSSKLSINPEDLDFTDFGNPKADRFLRDYFINQRWRHPNRNSNGHQIPPYSKVLLMSGMTVDDDDDDRTDGTEKQGTINYFNDDQILDEDDDFLVKVDEHERARLDSTNNANSDLVKQFRFEEDDKEYIKSYPRHVESSIGASMSQVSKRAEKRHTRIERKKNVKKIKMRELDRLKQLKLAMLTDKFRRIQRSCGFSDLDTTNTDMAMYLDEDWDPQVHNKFVNKMFDENYNNAMGMDADKPEFSDDSDSECLSDASDSYQSQYTDSESNKLAKKSTNQTERHSKPHLTGSNIGDNSNAKFEVDQTSSLGGRKRVHWKRQLNKALAREKPLFDRTKFPDYEKYFDEYYQLNCEDIIPGETADDDIHCHFKYRQVVPDNYGLSTEDILTADVGELNSWLPLSRITTYRTEAEEQRDKQLYESAKQLNKKNLLIPSISKPNATWWPSDNNNTNENEEGTSKPKKSKRRRKKKNHNLPAEMTTESLTSHTTSKLSDNQQTLPANSIRQNSKKKSNKMRKISKGLIVSNSRLEGAGITSKEYYQRTAKTECL